MTALDFFHNNQRSHSFLSDVLENFYNLDRELHPQRSGTLQEGFRPSCNVTEADNHYILSFDLPGINREDINLEITDDRLVVSGERKQEEEIKEGKYYRLERSYGHFQRAFQLPLKVKAEQIKANYENGVLKVAIPKEVEEAPSKKIEIGTGAKNFFERLVGNSTEKA